MLIFDHRRRECLSFPEIFMYVKTILAVRKIAEPVVMIYYLSGIFTTLRVEEMLSNLLPLFADSRV